MCFVKIPEKTNGPNPQSVVFAFTSIKFKCKRKERKMEQLWEGYPSFILRLLLFSTLSPFFLFVQICKFSVIILTFSLIFFLSCLFKCCHSAEMVISSLLGQLKYLQFIFACHLLKKGWKFLLWQQKDPLVTQKQQLHHLRSVTSQASLLTGCFLTSLLHSSSWSTIVSAARVCSTGPIRRWL